MEIALAGDIDAPWRRELAAALPEARWHDAAQAPATCTMAVVANPPPGVLAGLPRLAFVQSLWAGVDRLLADATLPPQVALARMVDPAMAAAMAETALWAVLSVHRGFFDYQRRQRDACWQVHPQRRADEVPVLVLGQGEMGGAVTRRLQAQGYRVAGWRRGVPLAPLLAVAEVVVNLLPLTPETSGIVDARFLAALPRGAALINLGRGGHVVEADLLQALDSGALGHAVLDVFRTEPLPAAHPFWEHPRVTVLPHAAALTDARSASAVAAANLRDWHAGRPVRHRVDRLRGY